MHIHRGGHFARCQSPHMCWCEQLRYLYALVISAVIAVIQIIGWQLSGSIALLCDVGHVLADSIGFAFALVLSIYIRKKVSRKRRSIRILGFAFQIVLLTSIVVWMAIETIGRVMNPPEVAVVPLIITAVIGGMGNLAQLAILRELKNLTAYGAWLHAVLDLGSSVMVIVGGIALWITRDPIVDPIAALVILLLLVGHIVYMLKKAGRTDARHTDHTH